MTPPTGGAGLARSRFAAGIEASFFGRAWALAGELEAFEWASPARIREAQWERARALLEHAVRTVPHYGRLFAEHGLTLRDITPDTYHKIPVLTKPTLRDQFPDNITSRVLPRPRQTHSTSGTTGLPLRVYRDPSARSLDRAIRRWHYGWCGLGPGDIVAYIKLMRTVTGFIYPFWAAASGCRFYNTDALYRSDHTGLARALNRWRPAAIYGSPMTLSDAALLLREGGCSLGFTPKAVITGTLTLAPDVERLIADTFGAPVHNRYGAAEFGTWMAQSCPDLVRRGLTATENLHVNAWRFRLEVVDEDGLPVAPGREGRIVITDLFNRVMPLIRYDIGDVGALAARPCACGRGLPLLQTLGGRTNEVVILPSGATFLGWRLYVALEPYAGAFRAYQFTQTDTDRLVLSVVPVSPSFGPSDAARLEKTIRDALPEPMRVSVEPVSDIPVGSSGKRTILRTLSEVRQEATRREPLGRTGSIPKGR